MSEGTTKKLDARIGVRFRRNTIRKLRAEHKMTQIDLATDSKLGLATIARVEREYTVSIETAKSICAVFNIDIGRVADVLAGEIGTDNGSNGSNEYHPQFFEIMMKELAEIVGKDQSDKVMDKLFESMRRFPFGKYSRNDLSKLKKYDTEALIRIL